MFHHFIKAKVNGAQTIFQVVLKSVASVAFVSDKATFVPSGEDIENVSILC